MTDLTLAFPVQHHDLPAIEVRVNFGMFAGRGATPAEIDRKIRAFNPWPAAFTLLRVSEAHPPLRLKIFGCIQSRKSSGTPGQVLRADRHGILVAAGKGAVLLRDVQLEGKKRMSARDFLLGNAVTVGSIFGERKPDG